MHGLQQGRALIWTMGIYINYNLYAKCSERELLNRLDNVRRRCLELPLAAVHEVRIIAPVYNPMIIRLHKSLGHVVPGIIADRLASIEDQKEHGLLCIDFGLMPGEGLPKRKQLTYIAPA